MREIKFRQWNSLKKRFQFDIGVTGPAFCTWESYPLEQYTGLKDKNGREIYEGDILGTKQRIISEQRPLAIEWDEDYACFCITRPELRGETASLGNLNLRFWKVIGNIHENPELLEAK